MSLPTQMPSSTVQVLMHCTAAEANTAWLHYLHNLYTAEPHITLMLIMLISFWMLLCTCACSEADIAAAKASTASSSGAAGGQAWDAPKQDEDITKQPQHAKVRSGCPCTAEPDVCCA